MRNILWAANLRSRRAIPREVHKEEYMEERLVFMVGNGDRDWEKVIFLTKSPFLLPREDTLLYIVLLAPDSTTDIPLFVPEVVEYLCRVGKGFLVAEWAQSIAFAGNSTSRNIIGYWNAIWFFTLGRLNDLWKLVQDAWDAMTEKKRSFEKTSRFHAH